MMSIFKRILYNKSMQKKKMCQPYNKYTRDIINEISYKELLEKVKIGAIVIDVRTKQEYNEGHLDGAILIPYFEITKKIGGVVANKDKVIIVYCQNGGRSEKAYNILNKLGYKNIFNLREGIEGIRK